MICTKKDEFLDEKTYWMATLSDGTTAYGDDERPDVQPSSAWVRLGIFLAQNPSLYIEKLSIHFRTNSVELPSYQDGYYFGRLMMGGLGSNRTTHGMVLGYYKRGETVECWQFKTPELMVMRIESKDLEKCSPKQLILKPT